MTQTDGVYALLRRRPKRGITALDVFRAGYGMRAAARVADLRKRGVAIEADIVKLPSGQRVARYRLAA